MIVIIIIAALLLVMGIVILIGKGDNLIAGYNTASEEERAKYNVKKLRGLIGGFIIVLAPLMVLFLAVDSSKHAGFEFAAVTTLLAIILIILANTWAKK
ncbi:MAG: DUF3784 domain-containing protein [Bacteroidales bacterium]|nr:DUF3784 domain-containing protein [Bacteroidales bacterium]